MDRKNEQINGILVLIVLVLLTIVLQLHLMGNTIHQTIPRNSLAWGLVWTVTLVTGIRTLFLCLNLKNCIDNSSKY